MSEGIRGQSGISRSDVAAALAYGSLSKHAYHMGLAKYCNDKGAEGELLKHLERKIQRTIHKKKWRDADGRAKGLSLLVIQESVHGLLCKQCGGRGFIMKSLKNDGLVHRKPCEKCGGSGMGQLSETQRARITNIATSNWIKTWKPRNEEFMNYALDLETKVLQHLKRQLLS